MTRPLDGCTVVVTRPAAQAGPFIERAQADGAKCIALPTLVIEPLDLDRASADAALGPTWDWAIYTSVNAVEFAATALGRLPKARRVAAVGRATARALERHGIAADLRPDAATSEGLLAAPELQQVGGRSVLLVKGAGGRDLLRETLGLRGGIVRTAEVYRRARVVPDPAAVAAVRRALDEARDGLVVAVTSAEVLEALLQLLPSSLAQALRDAALLVPGARVASAARDLSWRGRILQAGTAEDAAMIAALHERAAGATPPAC